MFSISLARTAEDFTPGYFCVSFNEYLDIPSDCNGDISGARAPPPTARPALNTNSSTQTVIPVSSFCHLQSLRPLGTIHSMSLTGHQADEELSCGGIQSLLSRLPATPSLHKGLHIWATFKFCLCSHSQDSLWRKLLCNSTSITEKEHISFFQGLIFMGLIIWLFTKSMAAPSLNTPPFSIWFTAVAIVLWRLFTSASACGHRTAQQ